MRKETVGILPIIMILFSLTLMNVTIASPDPVVFVDPQLINQPIGVVFDVNITIANVTDLYGWEFNVTFDPSVLNCTGIVEGPFLKQAGTTWPLPPKIDNDAGFVFAGSSLFPPPANGASGNGTLATITFNVTANGASAFHFSKTKLNGWVGGLPVPISHTAVGSFFSNITDAAVIDVLPAKNEAYPTWTIPLNITVTVMNNAPTPKNFTVRAYYENVTAAYEIGTQNVTNLTSGSQLNLTFSWSLTDIAWGLYTTKANVTLAGDINPANNEFVYGTVTIKIPGDIAGDPDPPPSGPLGPADGDVDWYDFGDFAAAYGSHYGQPRYNVESDLDKNDDVDWFDFGDFAAHYGKSTSAYP